MSLSGLYYSSMFCVLCPCLQPEDLNKLNVLHVTGTKGKGSTSAFTDSILRHAMPQWKVGEYE